MSGGWQSPSCFLSAVEPRWTLWTHKNSVLFTTGVTPFGSCSVHSLPVDAGVYTWISGCSAEALPSLQSITSPLFLSPKSVPYSFLTVGYDVSPNKISPWVPWQGPAWHNLVRSITPSIQPQTHTPVNKPINSTVNHTSSLDGSQPN